MRIIRLVLLGISALLAITIVLLVTVDLGRFKNTTETFVSNLLEREFAIGGALHIHLGRQIRIVAEDVTLADAEWSSADAFVSVGRFEGSINAWSLISPPVIVESLGIDTVRINLHRNESGEDNWVLSEVDAVANDQPQERPTLPVVFTDALITDLVVTYASPLRAQPVDFAATEIRMRRTDTDQQDLYLVGKINQTPLELNANAGTISQLTDLREVDFGLSGRLGEMSFEVEAKIDDVLLPHQPTGTVQLQGPNAEYLTDVLRMQQVTTGPLDLTATMAPVGDKMQLLITGMFGQFALDVSGQFVDLQDLTEVDARVAASGPDSSAVARLFGNDNVPAEPFAIVGNLKRSGQSLEVDGIKVSVGKSRFDISGRFDDFPDPHSARASIVIEAPDFGQFNRLLGLPGRLTGPFKLDADLSPLADGGAIVNLNAVTEDMQFEMVGNVSRRSDFVGTRVEVKSTGRNFQILAAAAGINAAPEYPFKIDLLIERVAEGAAIENGALSIGDNRFSFQGMVGNEPLKANSNLQFDLSGPNLAGTLSAFGRDADELPEAEYKASGRIERGADHFIVHELKGTIGENREYSFEIDGEISPTTDFVGSKLRVSTKGQSLGALTDAAGVAGIPDLPFQFDATVERLAQGISIEDGDARIGNDRVKLHGLIADQPLHGDTNIAFEAHAPDFKASLKRFDADFAEVPTGTFDATGQIRYQGEYFTVEKLNASLAGARITVAGRLGTFPEMEGTKLTLEANGAELSRLLPDVQKFSALNKPFGLSAKVVIRNQQLSLNDVAAFVDDTRLTANIDLRLAPMFGNGKFSVDAGSPDLFHLFPRLEDIAVSDKAPLQLQTDGQWADNVWTLDNFSLRLGKGTLIATGAFDGPPDFGQTDLRFTLNVESLRNLSVLAGQELPDAPARLDFHLLGRDGMITAEEFTGSFGDSDIRGEFILADGDVRKIRLGLKSNRLNLAPYLPALTENTPSPNGGSIETGQSDRVIPDTAIPMDQLDKYRVSANIDIAELNLRQHTLRDVLLVAEVEDGALAVTNFTVRSSRDETLTGELELRPTDAGAELLLTVRGNSLSLGLPATTEEEAQALPKYDVDTILHGSGNTLRNLAGSLDGYFRLVAGEGTMRTRGLHFFTNDFLSQVLVTVNPFVKADPYSHYQCAAVLLRLQEGLVTGKPAAVVQTDRLRIFANADVNLKTEKLHATINTVPTKGLGLSFSDLINPYTMISGTLAKPSLSLDPSGAILEGGAAVATGGVTILAKRFKDRFLSASDACGKAVADVDAEFQAIKEYYYPEAAAVQ